MTLREFKTQATTNQQGVSLITAIFLLVVLAGLGAAMVNVSTSQQTTSAMDVQGTRVYQAARMGIEWGVYQQLRGVPCAGTTTSFVPPGVTSLSGFTVTVTCATTTYTDATPNLSVIQITSNACNQPYAERCPGVAGRAGYIERQIQVSFL